MEYTLNETEDGAAVMVTLVGNFSFHDHKTWREIVEGIPDAGRPNYIIDLTGVDAIDSAGLGMLLYMNKEAEKSDVQMHLRFVGEGTVKAMLKLSQFEKLIPLLEE